MHSLHTFSPYQLVAQKAMRASSVHDQTKRHKGTLKKRVCERYLMR
jgi:hypothetical protein